MSKVNGKVILVTGGIGFLGRYVAKHFKVCGNYVIGIGNGSWGTDERKYWGFDEFHTAPITINNLLLYGRNPDVIVHCAGSGSVGFSVQNPHLDFARTVDSTAQMLEFARLHAPSASIVYPSSAAVYGCATQFPIPESAPLVPLSPYGVHKQMAEDLCRMYARNFGVKIAIVRLFSLYGPELRKQLLWDACQKLKRGISEFPGTGEESRDWLNAQDAASLLNLAASHASVDCPVINGGTGEAVTVSQMLKLVGSELGISRELRFTGEKRSGDPKNLVADITLAKNWGWMPKIARGAGIKNYIDWFKEIT